MFLPDPQFIVQHRCDRYGWHYVGERLATLDDAAEAMLADALNDVTQAMRWSVERLDREAGTVTDVTEEAYAAALAKIAERTDPRDLPDWHPAFVHYTEYQPRSLAEIVGGHI